MVFDRLLTTWYRILVQTSMLVILPIAAKITAALRARIFLFSPRHRAVVSELSLARVHAAMAETNRARSRWWVERFATRAITITGIELTNTIGPLARDEERASSQDVGRGLQRVSRDSNLGPILQYLAKRQNNTCHCIAP